MKKFLRVLVAVSFIAVTTLLFINLFTGAYENLNLYLICAFVVLGIILVVMIFCAAYRSGSKKKQLGAKKAQKAKPVKEEVAEPVKETVKEPVKEEQLDKKPEEKQFAVDNPGLASFYFHDEIVLKVSEGWVPFLEEEQKKETFKETASVISELYNDSSKVVYPRKDDLFKPFELTDISKVKAVIIGKLPFYRKNQADGLAFSSNEEAEINQSTKIILDEAVADVRIKMPLNGSLKAWAKQGVFMFNTCLTALNSKPAAHEKLWAEFANDVVKYLVNDENPKVFVLWGEHAQQFKELIEAKGIHGVLVAPNPSPLSAMNGFYGSKPFSKINEFLAEKGIEKINWKL